MKNGERELLSSHAVVYFAYEQITNVQGYLTLTSDYDWVDVSICTQLNVHWI